MSSYDEWKLRSSESMEMNVEENKGIGRSKTHTHHLHSYISIILSYIPNTYIFTCLMSMY